MTVTKQSLGAARLIWDITDPRRNDQMLAAVFDAAGFVERLLPGPCPKCGETIHCSTNDQLWDEGLVEVVADQIALGIYNNEIDLINAWSRDKSRDVARAVLAALAQEVGK